MALIVNGQRVDDGVLEQEFSGIKSYFESLGNVSCCERDPEFRGYARQNVLARILLAQEAKRAHPPRPAAEVDEAMEKLKADYGGEAQFLSAFGATPDQLDLIRQDVEGELRVKKMVDDLVDADGPAAEAELRAFYERNLEAFKTAEEVRASHVLKAPKRGEDRRAAYELLRDLRRRLREGADFDALAREHSDKGEEHVDLGFFKRGELAEEFECVAFSLEVGETSPVFASPFGYHLIRLTGRNPATPKPFDEVRADVEKLFADERRQAKTKELVERLQGEAVIEEAGEVAGDEAPLPAHAG